MERETSTLNTISLSALENLHCPVLITSASPNDTPDNPIVYANPAFEKLTGYSKNELLGRDSRFLQNNDQDQTALTEIKDALIKQVPIKTVLRNYRKNGTLFYNELFISPIHNNAGKVTHFVSYQNAIESPDSIYLRDQAVRLHQDLSPREQQVFSNLVLGFTNKETARILQLSPRTVEKHRLRLHKKMATNNLSLLIRYAIVLGYELNDIPQTSPQQPYPSRDIQQTDQRG